ncbi:protein Wnt-4-like [Dendronephthya gigantea]|uniref:protein Wnt-4-like n=1 Tax=Dendronephthya gigantea TaxID=151771 RepID=UPI00106B552D|nr:protein Wnt-4-like [Dendronephthya gigantea]
MTSLVTSHTWKLKKRISQRPSVSAFIPEILFVTGKDFAFKVPCLNIETRMKIRHLLVAFIYSLLFTDNDGYPFTSLLQFSKNSICRNDICRSKPSVMEHVQQGLAVALNECQEQFKNRRWNCTEKGGSIEKIMRYDFRESAFFSAIHAAGVTYVVTRACSLGDLDLCGCDAFKYRQGMTTASRKIASRQIAQRFADRGVCDRNINFGEEISQIAFTDKTAIVDARTLLIRWNFEAGRKVLRKMMKKTCKCFGYSQACTQKACWLLLPQSFSLVGAALKERFDSASKVSFGNKGKSFQVYDKSMKPPTQEDLVYTSESPTFCNPDPSVGSLGTKGRYCNATSMGTDGCDIMCCDRGYKTSVEYIKTSCNCRFRWCCKVKCKTCRKGKTVNTCL